MPGSQVKDWPLYEKLVAAGYSKESAARIANAQAAKKKGSSPASKRRNRSRRKS